jgi:hypothetical protein
MSTAWRAVLLAAGAAAFVALWLLLTPFVARPVTTLAGQVTYGRPEFCRPALVVVLAEGDGGTQHGAACRAGGAGRTENAVLFLALAGFVFLAGRRLFGPPAAPRKLWTD